MIRPVKSHKNTLFAVLSGLLLTLSFPPGKLDWVVWFALVPLLMGLEGEPPSRAFRLGLYAGLAHYLTLIYWIVVVLGHYGGLNLPISLAVLFLFCFYLALYPALFSLLSRYLRNRRFQSLTMAGLWVALEYSRARLLTGFPWCLLGYTQYRHLELIQIADLVGVYGLSFMILLSNGLIYALLRIDRPWKRPALWVEAGGIVVLFLLVLAYGHHETGRKTSPKGRPVNIAIVQGNIDQSVKWRPAYQEKTVDRYVRLTRTTKTFRPDLILWPETSVPFFFQDNTEFAPKITRLAKEMRAHLIFGSPAYRIINGQPRYYNRAYWLSPDGDLSGHYDKTHLVPFGEYVPLKKYLPFIHRLVTAAGDFASGKEINPLKVPHLSPGVLICFEVIFPELARAHVSKGAKLLINLTNDAWFGRTSAPFQHLSMAVFRAVENRCPLVRSANTGFSAFINPSGEIIQRGKLFQDEVLVQEMLIGPPSHGFYTKYGDLFAIFLLIIILIIIFYPLCYTLIKRQHLS